jgi:hypothetical protein
MYSLCISCIHATIRTHDVQHFHSTHLNIATLPYASLLLPTMFAAYEVILYNSHDVSQDTQGSRHSRFIQGDPTVVKSYPGIEQTQDPPPRYYYIYCVGKKKLQKSRYKRERSRVIEPLVVWRHLPKTLPWLVHDFDLTLKGGTQESQGK